MNISPKVIDTVVVIIVLAWAGSLVYAGINADYKAPANLTELMMMVGGYIFARQHSNSESGDTDGSRRSGTDVPSRSSRLRSGGTTTPASRQDDDDYEG